MRLGEISQYLKASVTGNPDMDVTGLQYDSRKIQAGNLFACIKGVTDDGHNYIGQAVKNGATALLVERPTKNLPPTVSEILVADTRAALARISSLWYGFPCQSLRMIGVTGTNGKTTTTHLIKGILEQSHRQVGLIGTIHNLVGDKRLPASHTTPESLELADLLHTMRQMGTSTVVMEVSSHALKQNRVAGCEFDGVVFTNLSRDHLDYHVTWDDYLASKLKLFTHAHLGVKTGPKYAVVNADDAVGPEFIKAAKIPVYTYGIEQHADIVAKDITMSPRGTSFRIKTTEGTFFVTTPLAGMFNVYNTLAAITVALAEGISSHQITDYLPHAEQVAGRFELVSVGQDFTVVVDYAHTPDGLENVLSTAKQLIPGRLITVFGCGGDRDRGKRPVMGEISGKYSDFTIVTSDNPRTEDPHKILSDIEAGISPVTRNYLIIEDRKQAIREAIKGARAGDLVMIAGKGHENYQLINGKVYPFDDREVAKEVLIEK